MGIIDRLNKGIDGVLTTLKLADPSINTNPQMLELMQTGIVSLDSLDSLINIMKTYNPSIENARKELREYMEALLVGNRADSEEKRKAIEQKMSSSFDNNEDMSFTKIVAKIYNDNKGEVARRQSKKYKKEQAQIAYSKTLSKEMDQVCTMMTMARNQGKITDQDLYVAYTVRELICNGNMVIQGIEAKKAIEALRDYTSSRIDSGKSKDDKEDDIPDDIKKLKKLVGTEEYKQQRKKVQQALIASKIEAASLDQSALQYMIHDKFADKIDIIHLLTLFGLSNTEDLTQKNEIAVLRADSADLFGMYPGQIDSAIKILRDFDSGKTPTDCTASLDRYLTVYQECKEAAPFYSLPEPERLRIVNEPIKPGDSEFVKGLKQMQADVRKRQAGAQGKDGPDTGSGPDIPGD